jgi:uncharacterized protein (DUF1501 family)
MGAVHATGLAVPNRSHFAAMEAVEDATPGSSERVGWLNRLIGDMPGTSPLQAVAIGSAPPSLYGPQPWMGFDRLDEVGVAGDDQWDPTDDRLAGQDVAALAQPAGPRPALGDGGRG